MERRVKNNKGFTIVEILVAMALLGIIAVPLASIFMDTFKFQARSQVKTEANKVIEYVTEQIKKENYFVMGADGYNIKEGCRGEGLPSSINNVIDSLPNGNLSYPYDVKFEVKSKEEVQKGGLGTPSEYDLEMAVDESGASFNYKYYGLDVSYDNGILTIDDCGIAPINGSCYNVKIDNDVGSRITINVRKKILENVKFYLFGDISLSIPTMAEDLELSKDQKFFEQVNVGDKDEIKDEKEYLCEAVITATNQNDNSITASMNISYNVFIENNEGT